MRSLAKFSRSERQGQRGACVFLTTKIFNISPFFFNINTNINIKIPKKFNINIKINILEMQISISISKSIFWSCSFQYQNQYQYVQNFDFSKVFKILCHVWLESYCKIICTTPSYNIMVWGCMLCNKLFFRDLCSGVLVSIYCILVDTVDPFHFKWDT